ncbi:GrpB family protein [Agromyces soli]
MPTPQEIVDFTEPPAPDGRSPFVRPQRVESVEVVAYDEAWPVLAAELIARVRSALGARAIQLDHVGSTSVPGLPAKPVIDLDLTVADPDREEAWLPRLERAGFELTVREPWWHGHRCLVLDAPRANLHVFGPSSPELFKHRIFRDWLRSDADDRARYAAAKAGAARAATEAGETVMQYNARKAEVIQEIYGRAFRAAGLLD